jgi:hypothetical protein
VCQEVRAPGSNVTIAPLTRAGSRLESALAVGEPVACALANFKAQFVMYLSEKNPSAEFLYFVNA